MCVYTYTYIHICIHVYIHTYIYTMRYYSAIKRNTFGSVPMRWMNLEPTSHSEVRKKETNIMY